MAATKDSVTPVTRERVPWRSIGVGVTTVGTPTGLAMLHPMLGVILGGTEVVVALQIMTTALYGSSILSERAFRLLRWIGNQPEPSAPAPATGPGHLRCLHAAHLPAAERRDQDA